MDRIPAALVGKGWQLSRLERRRWQQLVRVGAAPKTALVQVQLEQLRARDPEAFMELVENFENEIADAITARSLG
jgi:hypothetical protein